MGCGQGGSWHRAVPLRVVVFWVRCRQAGHRQVSISVWQRVFVCPHVRRSSRRRRVSFGAWVRERRVPHRPSSSVPLRDAESQSSRSRFAVGEGTFCRPDSGETFLPCAPATRSAGPFNLRAGVVPEAACPRGLGDSPGDSPGGVSSGRSSAVTCSGCSCEELFPGCF